WSVATGDPMPLLLPQPVVDQRYAAQPLAGQPPLVLTGHLLAHRAERRLVHVLELPARVVGPEDPTHRGVTNHVAQLVVEELRLGVHPLIVGDEVAVALAHHRDRLTPALEVEKQHPRLEIGIARPVAVRLEEPAGLELREPFVQERFAPLVVREHPHRVIVSHLVQDEPQAGAPSHHHHRKLRRAALDAMDVAHLRPGELAVQRVEPGERGDRPAQRDRKSTRLNSSHGSISYAVFCLKKKKETISQETLEITEVDELDIRRTICTARKPRCDKSAGIRSMRASIIERIYYKMSARTSYN